MAAERSINATIKDISVHRGDFPMMSQNMNGKPLVFLDTASSAQKPQIVIDVMRDIEENRYANIHRGLYDVSQQLTADYESVRQKIANFIHAESEHNIVFTRNSTEAINLVAQSYGRANLESGDEIIISAMEHHANIVPWQLLRDQIGVVLKIIPIDARGVLDLDAYQALLSDKTKIISIVQTSNSLGTINPVKDMIETAKAYNDQIITLVDGSQSVVHGQIDVQDIGCDFFTFTGHKLYGPTGIGALYGRYSLLEMMEPYQGGGDMIDYVTFEQTTYNKAPFKFEAGTPAIVQVIGFGAAIDYVTAIGQNNIQAHEYEILSYATDQLSAVDGLTLHGTAPDKAGILSFTMRNTHPSDIGMVLDQCGIAIRTGHHCCMPLMQELSLDATARASIGLYSNQNDIDCLVDGLNKVKDMFS